MKHTLVSVCCLLVCLLALAGNPERANRRDMTLILAGDVMLGRGVAQALDGDWEDAFAGVRSWLAGDAPRAGRGSTLTFANLESPLTSRSHMGEGYDLRAPPGAATALRAGGFDAVSLANNHAMDAGEAGLRETVRALRAAGIEPWLNPAAHAAGRETIYAAHPRSPHRGLAFDDSKRPLDLGAAASAVSTAAADDDVVVVSIHWGGEYQATPSSRQQEIARVLAAAGADVIVGHGPHVLQRVEWIGQTLVAYSLGNFLFDQPYPADCSWGVILRVTLMDGQARSVEALPTVVERGRVRPADPETAGKILRRLRIDPAKLPGDGQGA